MPEGFAYREGAISEDEETNAIRFMEELPFKPFEFHGYLGNRRVVSYGWRYDYAAHSLRGSPPLPDFLNPLRAIAANFAGLPAESLQQALITEYAPGAGIGWHKDKPQFGDTVGLSLLAEARLRLRRKQGPRWQRLSKDIQPRSVYLLSGDVRQNWEHSIPPQEQLRYSVTFRTRVATK